MNLLRPVDRDVHANGARLRVLDWGGEGRTPLLLLHGFTGHAHAWDTLSIALQPHFHVYALDQRGHGDSDPADTYNAVAAFDDIFGVVDQLGLTSSVLVGLSMGGRNAMYFTSKRPDLIQKLVVVDVELLDEVRPLGGEIHRVAATHREPDEDGRGQTELVDDAEDVVEGRDGVVRVGRITVTMTALVEGVDVKVGLQRDAERVPRVRMSREPVQEQERRATVAAPVEDVKPQPVDEHVTAQRTQEIHHRIVLCTTVVHGLLRPLRRALPHVTVGAGDIMSDNTRRLPCWRFG